VNGAFAGRVRGLDVLLAMDCERVAHLGRRDDVIHAGGSPDGREGVANGLRRRLDADRLRCRLEPSTPPVAEVVLIERVTRKPQQRLLATNVAASGRDHVEVVEQRPHQQSRPSATLVPRAIHPLATFAAGGRHTITITAIAHNDHTRVDIDGLIRLG
jgi:hypothetical protein